MGQLTNLNFEIEAKITSKLRQVYMASYGITNAIFSIVLGLANAAPYLCYIFHSPRCITHFIVITLILDS